MDDDGNLTFGTWAAFYKEVTDAFLEEGGQMKAAIKLASLKMSGNMAAETYIDDFKDLVQRSGLKDNIAIIRDFEHGLKKSVADQIYNMDTLPATPEEWYKAAICFDNRQKSRRVYEGSDMRRPADPTTSDPNAMIVDRMSIEERRRHVTGGLCFQCHQPGHMARDHKNGKFKGNKGNFQYKGNSQQVRTAAVEETSEEAEIPTASPPPISEEPGPSTRIARLRAELGALSQEERREASEYMAEQGF